MEWVFNPLDYKSSNPNQYKGAPNPFERTCTANLPNINVYRKIAPGVAASPPQNGIPMRSGWAANGEVRQLMALGACTAQHLPLICASESLRSSHTRATLGTMAALRSLALRPPSTPATATSTGSSFAPPLETRCREFGNIGWA